MRVFVTGATGFIGMEVTAELIAAGHSVLGLCRSDAKAAALAQAGAHVFMGNLEDLNRLREGAAQADAAIHLAFNHDLAFDPAYGNFAEAGRQDARAIEALGAALAGSARPLIVTSGVAMAQAKPGQPITENDEPAGADALPRISEIAAARAREAGANVAIMRLPQVHDTTRQGLVTYAIAAYRQKGVCAYIGDGQTRWAAAHVSDVARLYRLALERAEPGARYHAVAEEGVKMRDMAETIARRLNLPARSITPEEAPEFFGWIAMFAQHHMPASSAQTQRALNWTPTGPGMLADLERLHIE